MRTRFMCSINNEAVPKALFKVKDGKLTFTKALQIAQEIEEAAQVAKETVWEQPSSYPVNKIQLSRKETHQKTSMWSQHSRPATGRKPRGDFPAGTCPRCGKCDHGAKDCPFLSAVCNYCQKTGHLQAVCLKKKDNSPFTLFPSVLIDAIPQVRQPLYIKREEFTSKVDTGAGDNLCSTVVWTKLGKPKLTPTTCRYEVANGQALATLRTFQSEVHYKERTPGAVLFSSQSVRH